MRPKKYTHIFFDLDHTLWDFESNSNQVKEMLFHDFLLYEKGVPSPEKFIEIYKPINEKYWALYHKNSIDKETLRVGRFAETLQVFDIHDLELSDMLAKAYLAKSPYQKKLMPNTIEILQYLYEKYPLYIITNGFTEVQKTKMESSGLNTFFQEVFISEEIGFQKPSVVLFKIIMEKCNASPYSSVMIGDNMKTDIQGARLSGLDQIYYNPERRKRIDRVTYEIYDLLELKNIL